jgi:endonuclease/exonuclease/phosphatase family metal-dependent hydrolase
MLEGPKIPLGGSQAKTVNINGRLSVKILTINLFMRPLVNTNGSDHKEGRLKAFAEHYLGEYDIICFQELFDWLSTRKHRIILEAKNAGMPYHAFSPGPQFLSTYIADGGLLTVSKFPITKSDFVNYKYPPVGDDAIAMKGALYTEIDLSEVGGDKLHLFHSHFQASYYGKGIPLYVETFVCRYEQVKEMQKFVQKHTFDNPDYNRLRDIVILAGDFNQNASPMNVL